MSMLHYNLNNIKMIERPTPPRDVDKYSCSVFASPPSFPAFIWGDLHSLHWWGHTVSGNTDTLDREKGPSLN